MHWKRKLRKAERAQSIFPTEEHSYYLFVLFKSQCKCALLQKWPLRAELNWNRALQIFHVYLYVDICTKIVEILELTTANFAIRFLHSSFKIFVLSQRHVLMATKTSLCFWYPLTEPVSKHWIEWVYICIHWTTSLSQSLKNTLQVLRLAKSWLHFLYYLQLLPALKLYV